MEKQILRKPLESATLLAATVTCLSLAISCSRQKPIESANAPAQSSSKTAAPGTLSPNKEGEQPLVEVKKLAPTAVSSSEAPGASTHQGSLKTKDSQPRAAESKQASAPVTPSQVTPAPAPAEKPCFKITWVHSPAAKHHDEESCANHKNVITLPESLKKASLSTACLRIDGRPTAFKKTAGELLALGTVGPQSKITLEYCEDPARKCFQSCIPQRDSFAEALSGETGELNSESGDSETEVKMQAALEGDLKRELAALDESESDNGLFKNWLVREQKQVNQCSVIASGS